MNEITTEPLKATWKTSYFVIFAATVAVVPFLIIGLIWLANRVLPVEDAAAFKEPLWTIWKWMAGASGLATLAGGLLRTHGKITAQVEQMKAEVKQAAQPLKGVALGYSDGKPFYSYDEAQALSKASPLPVIDDNDGDGPQDDEAVNQ